MTTVGVALQTQERALGVEQVTLVGAVHIVAVGAVFAHRGVFPDKGTALFLMAAETGLVDRCPLQQALADRTMDIMTIGAGHLSFAHRVMISLVHLRPHVGVTAVTKGFFILGAEERPFALLLHDGVTGDAADTGGLMGAALPVDLFAALVALQTDRCLLRRTRGEFPAGIFNVLTA